MKVRATIGAVLLSSAMAMPAIAEEWYEGGTLHEAAISEWQTATQRDKMATAADWTATIVGVDRLKALGGMTALQFFSAELVTCLDGATEDMEVEMTDEQINTYAGLCAMMMGWQSK